MARKTGKDGKVEIEVGTTFYPMAALTSVSSPAADVRKKYKFTGAQYASDQESLQPDIRLDGVISGFEITAGTANNSVDVAAGKVYIKGVEVSVSAVTKTGLMRPLVAGQVLVNALTVDENGTINITQGLAGTAGGARGAAGGNPYLPINEVLLGYINMTYYDGSASGEDTVLASEIDSESKERTIIPSYKIHYHNETENIGLVEFASVLPLIHGTPSDVPAVPTARNVYGSYYAVSFEELAESKDFGFTDDIATIDSKAYGDTYAEKALSTPNWSMSGSAFWTKVQDIMNLVKNSKRWVKLYPDKDETAHWVGRGIIKVNRDVPVDGNLEAAITIEGSGELYDKAS